jgi:hypothetical protein
VIAPWYQGANGQIDERIRVAAETLKRYPWTPPGKAPRQLPEYMWSGAWKIAPDGTITIPPIKDWANGDLGQRAAYVLGALIDYYRYSGEAWAVTHVQLQADMLLDFCLTGDDHPWPRFLISVPTKGKPYGPADSHGFIQLDIVAEVGIQMVRAAQLCGSDRYMEAAKHWGDLLAERRIREPGVNPWPRYANPDDAPWEDVAKGGVAFILENIAFVWKGPRPVSLPPNTLPNDAIFTLGSCPKCAVYRWDQFFVILVTIPVLLGLVWLVRYTRRGKAMRATAQDRDAAAMMGIDVNRTISFTFLVAGALAGAAGVIFTLYGTTIQFNTGFTLGLIAFTAAVLGGIGNLPGAVLGGLLIGFIQDYNEGLSWHAPGSAWTNSIVFGILILILVFRPQGLLGEQTPEGG